MFRREPKPVTIFYDDEVAGLNIRDIYKRLLWESDRAGVKRRACETPLEYAQRLEKRLPGGQVQLDGITGLYSQVRYGEKDLSSQQKEHAIGLWVALREHIRGIGEKAG